jgi:uncharacterized protein (DUF1778 family)
MNNESAKTARLDARLPQSVLDLIKTAADLQGRSLSEFVIGSAREAAERTLQEQSRMQLSLDDQIRFAKAMLGLAEGRPGDASRRQDACLAD